MFENFNLLKERDKCNISNHSPCLREHTQNINFVIICYLKKDIRTPNIPTYIYLHKRKKYTQIILVAMKFPSLVS